MAESHRNRLERECTDMLYEQSRSGVAALVVAALLLGGLLWGTVPTAALAFWLVLVVLLALVRVALVVGYERVHRIEVALRWRWYFVAVIALQGLAWGSGGAFFFAHSDAINQLVIALVIGGFAVIAIPYMAPVFVAYAVFTGTMLGSFLTGFFLRADKGSIALGAMIAVILPALLMIAHIYRRKLHEALQLAYENAALVTELRNYREQLETRVAQRTEELREANREMEAFNYSVSHDLRGPLRAIDGYGGMLMEDYSERLDAKGHDMIVRLRAATRRMDELIDALLSLSRISRGELVRQALDLSALAEQVARQLQASEPERSVRWKVQPGMRANGDKRLLVVVLENLLGNAWKYTRHAAGARVDVGCTREGGRAVFYVHDNGVGFDPRFQHKLFGAFQRLHDHHEFEGTGIGLATVARIVRRHGGEVWARSDDGATFYFTLGEGEVAT